MGVRSVVVAPRYPATPGIRGTDNIRLPKRSAVTQHQQFAVDRMPGRYHSQHLVDRLVQRQRCQRTGRSHCRHPHMYHQQIRPRLGHGDRLLLVKHIRRRQQVQLVGSGGRCG